MSYYEQQFLKEVQEKKERKERGEYNGIPLCFENYRDYVESIDKGIYYALLSSTGSGKSFWMRHTFIYEPLKFSQETGYKIKILYFALEDSQMQVYKKIAAHYLWEHKGVLVSQKYLDSKIDPLPDKYLNMLKEQVDFFEYFEDNVHIISDDLDPDSILETCLKYYKKFGNEYHYIAIIDNYANITKGDYINEYEAISALSRTHIRLNLCKELGFSVLAILQQDQESEKNTARNAGGNISAVEPNIGSIGKNKVIAQDFHVLWALFNPWRYSILTYPNTKGYNIDLLRNKFRSLNLLKNSIGEMAPRLGLYFDGSKGTFEELPAINDEEALRKIYDKVLMEEAKIRESRSQKS